MTKKDAIKLGYDKSKIFIVNNGVDERFFSTPKPTNRGGANFVVGYLGAFAPRKNVPFAVRAFKKIDERGVAFRVWGRESYDYKMAVAAAAGDRAIEFMGFAPDDKIVQIYDSFDVFVFPSTYEGFGIPIIEAMSRGLPVIINKEGRIPEEVRKYCFEAKDEAHMAQIIKDLKANGYDDKLRIRATAYARKFTWKRCAEQTIKTYEEILK